MAIKVKSHNGPGMGGTVRLGISGCIEPGVLRCRVDALVDVRDVAGGRLAEMRTAGVDLNTRQMRAGICRSGNEAHKWRKHGVFTEVNASGIPWPLAVADVPEGAHRRAETGRNGGPVRF